MLQGAGHQLCREHFPRGKVFMFMWPSARVRHSLLLNLLPAETFWAAEAHPCPQHTYGVRYSFTAWSLPRTQQIPLPSPQSKQHTKERLHLSFNRSSGKAGLWCLSSQAPITRAEAVLPRVQLDICLLMGSGELILLSALVTCTAFAFFIKLSLTLEVFFNLILSN